jgi:hypothetical protein
MHIDAVRVAREAFKSRTYSEFRPVSLIVPIDFSALITTLFWVIFSGCFEIPTSKTR